MLGRQAVIKVQLCVDMPRLRSTLSGHPFVNYLGKVDCHLSDASAHFVFAGFAPQVFSGLLYAALLLSACGLSQNESP